MYLSVTNQAESEKVMPCCLFPSSLQAVPRQGELVNAGVSAARCFQKRGYLIWYEFIVLERC